MNKSLRVVVFCGSRPGDNPEWMSLAHHTGQTIAQRGHILVYGAGGRGLMGAVATGAREAGGRVVGYIPQWLVPQEGLSQEDFTLTPTMTERKQQMIEHSDAVIVLPGGIGTLDEIFEVLVLQSLNQYAGLMVCVGSEDFWQPLQNLLRYMHQHQLLFGPLEMIVVSTPEAALELCETHAERIAGTQ